jgi:hypothetical protein
MAYELEGRLLEVCDCKVLCPCWVGEDPDNGTCKGIVSYHIDRGTVNGLDVSGLTLAMLGDIPGNVMKGNWRVLIYVDDRATPAQEQALLDVFSGKLGGPTADFAQLIGDVVGIERAPITFDVREGQGRLQIGPQISAELSPLQGATGQSTTLHDTIFSTIPGSPAYVGKAASYRAVAPQLGFNIDLQGHNAIQGSFRFTA